MITLKNISKTFGRNQPNEFLVLRNLSLEIKQKDFVIIVGSNGSGKSTLLNIISGTVKPDEGSVLLDGKDITQLKDFQRSKWVARIFQNPLAGTAPGLTILENFRLAALRTKSKSFRIGTTAEFRTQIRERISFLNLGLENKLDTEIESLSGGQRQALTLLMATMDESKILLLDEPSAALDPKTSELIMNLAVKIITDFKLTAILVTHQMKDVVKFGNRVIQLKEGQIIRDIQKEKAAPLNVVDVYEWFND
jgi:putative ABC transport system ATP-binding protein